MMLAEWLYSVPEDISSWFVIPCPLGQRCLVVVHSHKTHIYGKYGNLIWTMHTNLPKQTILYCIYDKRTSIYHIIDIIMWNGQDYSTQIECQCRFFMLMSLTGDSRLTEKFQILPRLKIEESKDLIEAEDGYLFYHPLGFYEPDYSPIVCWLKPFMIEEILGIHLSYPIAKPLGYTTAQAYMSEEQSNRKEQQQQSVGKSHRKKKGNDEDKDNLMSVDE
jgi:snurportin-1